jgi:hypothetical protein
MAIWIEGFGFDLQFHAGKAAAGRFFLAASRLRAVDKKVGVMDQTFVAGMNFDGFDNREECSGERKIKFQ